MMYAVNYETMFPDVDVGQIVRRTIFLDVDGDHQMACDIANDWLSSKIATKYHITRCEVDDDDMGYTYESFF